MENRILKCCRGSCLLRNGAFAAMTLLAVNAAKCGEEDPDPLLAAWEKGIVGVYKLDNLLLAPGKLVVLPNANSLFADMGDTTEQAAKKGLLRPEQLAVLQRQDCTLTIRPDHRFAITNLPSPGLLETVSRTGTWSIKVYHVFDTYGYRITLEKIGAKAPALRAKFINADKPSLPMLEIFNDAGKKESLMFRFANKTNPGGSQR